MAFQGIGHASIFLFTNLTRLISILQEPGNFVITFPRSFHGGFNCGLNCAEAVNFAPADWLPHGGFGVELYRLYHKSAILSHEELLCVVAKSGCSPKTLPFLKKELIRVINSERTHREQLWKNGIVRISRMTSRKHPEYVGTEEDPECIICRYSLHLSAVVCSCRPGASVCVQHAERLCECNPDQQCLLYRYTMAELDDLLLMGDQRSADQDGEVKDSRVRSRRISTQKSTPLQTKSLVKKVKGRHVTHTELAEAWLTSARNMLRSPISQANIEDLLKQAEQFLWAGHEMDPVRAMEKDLIRAQKWVQDLTGCLSTVESWMHEKSRTSSKVPLKFAQGLIEVDEVPCIEPGFPKLKAMVEDANTLEQEIKSALSSSSPVKDVESLINDARNLPIMPREYKLLESSLHESKRWLMKAFSVLPGSSSQKKCTIQDLEDLVAESQVQMFFDCKSGITWTELLQLKEIGVSSIVEDAKLEMLLSKIADIGSWILHCKAVICHSASSSVPLRDFLLQIKDSLDRALRKFRRANSSDDMEDFCICNRHPREEIKSVIRCAKCKDRYHCLCLGLTPAQTWATGEYICPFCSAVTSGTLANEETYPKVSKRNRPTLDDLMQLLNEAEGLNARYISGTIEVAEVREQESSKIEVALSINSWRNRAKMLLGGPAKPYFRHIRRALKEGLSLHVASKDYFIQELRRLEHTASLWAVRAKQVVADHGALELDEVFKLIAEGESVPVDFGKLLAALKVRSVLYCICRKPYDEERAMIACDRCSEWYHFDCINLPEPDSSDEGCELLLQRECGPSGEFICPVCKPTQMQECSALHPKIDDYDSEFTSGEVSREGDGVTPPFEFVRGKRRSRLSGKSRSNLQERLKGNFNSRHQESSDMPSKDKKHPENPLTASGRPCRRTAGQNSKFESFVLLMHSRK